MNYTQEDLDKVLADHEDWDNGTLGRDETSAELSADDYQKERKFTYTLLSILQEVRSIDDTDRLNKIKSAITEHLAERKSFTEIHTHDSEDFELAQVFSNFLEDIGYCYRDMKAFLGTDDYFDEMDVCPQKMALSYQHNPNFNPKKAVILSDDFSYFINIDLDIIAREISRLEIDIETLAS